MKKIYLYSPPDGEPPFLKFLAGMEDNIRCKLEYGLKCLAIFPDFMTEPHVKHFSIERYSELYEYRERIRVLVRVIFVLNASGDIIILHAFVKKHDRNTMQALELSVRVLGEIKEHPDYVTEYQFEKELHTR